MTNTRTDWTNHLNAYNNVTATYNADARGWTLEASSFAVAGIEREGYFTVRALTAGRFVAVRTNKV